MSRKYSNRLRLSTFAKWLAVFTLSCGIATSYVFVRNGQVREADEIRETEARIAALHEEIDLYELRTARMMDRAVLTKRLEDQGSQLRPISPDRVITLNEADSQLMAATSRDE